MKRVNVFLLVLGLLAVAAIPALANGVFPTWHQGFETDTAGWIAGDTAGPAGWCGVITRFERGSGPVLPSKGSGYATVENNDCNDYWKNNGYQESGPYAPFGGYSESWPQSGFITELDIYLDPAWVDGTGFDYYVSIHMLSDNSFRYLLFPVDKTGGALLVAGHEVSQAGWYTFRVRFREQGGHLAVDFELSQHGLVHLGQPVTNTAFTGEAISSFQVANVGTGYAWFDAISAGLRLPIDHHRYRPGR